MKGSRPRALPRGSVDDATAMRRIAAGDFRALGHIYDRHAAQLLRFAARMSTWSDAEDIVHGVFLRVLRLAHTFDAHASSARPWLYALTSRMARERRRSLRRWAGALMRLSERHTALPTTVQEADPDLERALSRLGRKKREVLLLSDVEGFTGQEIASQLGIAIGTVWTRLHHARRELREYLGEAR